MPEPTIALRDAGDDLAPANTALRARGQPEPKLRRVCRHACPAEASPDRTELARQGTLALGDVKALKRARPGAAIAVERA
jgi:hypothetical protein